MPKGELFEDLRQCRPPLTQNERETAIRRIVLMAQTACKYFYTLKETCAVLHCSYDMVQAIIREYRLDVVLFLTAYRVPWYDLAGFILDDAHDTLREDLDDYLKQKQRNY